MSPLPDFAADIAAAYDDPPQERIVLGGAMFDGVVVPDLLVTARLSMLNRHGLVAGATGTGKTRSLQVMAEQLSAAGVPVVITDIKGDLSGMAAPAAPEGPARKRAELLGMTLQPEAQPVEFWALGGVGDGIPLRSTVSEFGPQLMAKVLGANETQEQVLYLVFRFADEQGLALVDLGDLRAVLEYLVSDAGRADLDGLGGVSPATAGVLLRSIIMLEGNDAAPFFGMPALRLADLMRIDAEGRGVISCVELPKVAESPQVFSAALMWIVAELFEQLPEVGDIERPKLVIIIDEAHLLFEDATDAFIESIVRTVRLVRSKGVGVFFCTQNPRDIHEDVLGQLGHRVQHALRAFTPQDQKAIKVAVQTMPTSKHDDLEQAILEMGIGEALVTTLDERGAPRPPVRTAMAPPRSSMGTFPDAMGAATASPLWASYEAVADPESAEELLEARMAASVREPAGVGSGQGPGGRTEPRQPRSAPKRPARARSKSDVQKVLDSRAGRQLQREVVRGLFGLLRSGMRGR